MIGILPDNALIVTPAYVLLSSFLISRRKLWSLWRSSFEGFAN